MILDKETNKQPDNIYKTEYTYSQYNEDVSIDEESIINLLLVFKGKNLMKSKNLLNFKKLFNENSSMSQLSKLALFIFLEMKEYLFTCS